MGRQLWRLATIPVGSNCVLRVPAYFVCRWILTDSARDATYHSTTYYIHTYYTFGLERGHHSGARVSPAATPAYVRDLYQVISLSHIPAPLQHHIFMAS